MNPVLYPLSEWNDADELSRRLLSLGGQSAVCILDSCGSAHQKARYMIAGVAGRFETIVPNSAPNRTLASLDEMESAAGFEFFTLSYDFGRALEIDDVPRFANVHSEPDLYRASCDAVVIHDYHIGRTWLAGKEDAADTFRKTLAATASVEFPMRAAEEPEVFSNFSRDEYIELIECVRELILRGVTYQTNLTQQLTSKAVDSPASVFYRLRKSHPASFAAFLDRGSSCVVSASPEMFISITECDNGRREIASSPIKGTRPRGIDADSDAALRRELLNSQKDRAENIMIVDLIRNDLGRVCEFGSVFAERICEIETHPTLFHLVSTVRGRLRREIRLSDIVRATFPCGSITGAPKISTMRIIDRLETANRGLSMGALGYCGPSIADLIAGRAGTRRETHMSVAIRTMTCEDDTWRFNVGGGIVIDSDAVAEYEETLTKARALLYAIGGKFSGNKCI